MITGICIGIALAICMGVPCGIMLFAAYSKQLNRN